MGELNDLVHMLANNDHLPYRLPFCKDNDLQLVDRITTICSSAETSVTA